MNYNNARRLLMLANFLEKNIKDEQFNLEFYMNKCGTIGCAVGWAGRIPQFNKEGFSTRIYDGYPRLLLEKKSDTKEAKNRGYVGELQYGESATKLYFGIDTFDFFYLFVEKEEKQTRKDTILKIRKFVKEKFPSIFRNKP